MNNYRLKTKISDILLTVALDNDNRDFLEVKVGLFKILDLLKKNQPIIFADVFTCDGCLTPYVRTKRKPPRGRHQFCDKCSVNNRGAKRLWARERRSP